MCSGVRGGVFSSGGNGPRPWLSGTRPPTHGSYDTPEGWWERPVVRASNILQTPPCSRAELSGRSRRYRLRRDARVDTGVGLFCWPPPPSSQLGVITDRFQLVLNNAVALAQLGNCWNPRSRASFEISPLPRVKLQGNDLRKLDPYFSFRPGTARIILGVFSIYFS